MTATLMQVFDIAGTIAFAMSGALTAMLHGLDLFGVLFLAVLTATGGGIARDVMLGYTPPFSLQNPLYVVLCILSALVVFRFATTVQRMNKWVVTFDAIGLGAFVATGAGLAYAHPKSNLYMVILMGIITATGGSMGRDVLVRRIPTVLIRTEIYATCCIVGSLLYYLIMKTTGNTVLAINVCAFSTIAMRFWGIHRRVLLPQRQLVESSELPPGPRVTNSGPDTAETEAETAPEKTAQERGK